MEHLEKIWNEFLKWLLSIVPNVIGAILILVIGWWLASLLSKYLKKAMTRAKAVSYTHLFGAPPRSWYSKHSHI